MAKTVRLDLLVVDRGLLPSRQAAQAAIMDGGIIVNGEKITKPGTPVKPDAIITLTGSWQGSKYVSRGGFKLERALQVFQIDVEGKLCLDLGASTGGFTDCLLKHGAARVFAIDVGYGQLDWSLRQDERVTVKERVNARHLTPDELYGKETQPQDFATLAVADLSFISICKVLPACVSLLRPQDAAVVALVKPQFEAGKEAVGKGGVVRSPETHLQVLQDSIDAAAELGLVPQGVTYSPIKGPAGNIEFLAYWKLHGPQQEISLKQVVEEAHIRLHNKESSQE